MAVAVLFVFFVIISHKRERAKKSDMSGRNYGYSAKSSL